MARKISLLVMNHGTVAGVCLRPNSARNARSALCFCPDTQQEELSASSNGATYSIFFRSTRDVLAIGNHSQQALMSAQIKGDLNNQVHGVHTSFNQ